MPFDLSMFGCVSLYVRNAHLLYTCIYIHTSLFYFFFFFWGGEEGGGGVQKENGAIQK